MVTEERVVSVETALARFMEQSNRILAAHDEDIAAIRASAAGIHADVAEIRAKLGDESFWAAWMSGHNMSLEEAIQCALGGGGQVRTATAQLAV